MVGATATSPTALVKRDGASDVRGVHDYRRDAVRGSNVLPRRIGMKAEARKLTHGSWIVDLEGDDTPMIEVSGNNMEHFAKAIAKLAQDGVLEKASE